MKRIARPFRECLPRGRECLRQRAFPALAPQTRRVAFIQYLPRHNAIENFPTHPALNTSSIKLPLGHSCFLRTYSARIYFIVSNSSLACLHMPHPSNPVDDISARSYNREHGRFVRSRGRFDRVSSPSSEWIEVRTSELGVRLMDFIP